MRAGQRVRAVFRWAFLTRENWFMWPVAASVAFEVTAWFHPQIANVVGPIMIGSFGMILLVGCIAFFAAAALLYAYFAIYALFHPTKMDRFVFVLSGLWGIYMWALLGGAAPRSGFSLSYVEMFGLVWGVPSLIVWGLSRMVGSYTSDRPEPPLPRLLRRPWHRNVKVDLARPVAGSIAQAGRYRAG